MNLRKSTLPKTNLYPGDCARCKIRIPENQGMFFEGPLRLVCSPCSLREDVKDDNGFLDRIAKENIHNGKKLELMPFQIEDCRRTSTTKALLLGLRMGLGKTVVAAMSALRADRPNLVFCPASVRENWVDEITKWRPDLSARSVNSQNHFQAVLQKDFKPGSVLVCSFGVLPGSPCLGCRALKAKLRQLRKWKRQVCAACDVGGHETRKEGGRCTVCKGETFNVPAPRYGGKLHGATCMHVALPGHENESYEDRAKREVEAHHPPFIDLRIDSELRRLPYHAKGDIESWIGSGVPVGQGAPASIKPEVDDKQCLGCIQSNPQPTITSPVVTVVDECHAFKTPSNQRTKNWRGLRKSVWEARGYVFGLSGTPCEGKPLEFWEVLTSLGLEKAAFGDFETYKRIFNHWFNNPKGSRVPPEGELREELHRRLRRVQINRSRESVLDQLPPRVEVTIPVEISQSMVHDVNEAVHKMLAIKRSWEDVTAGARFDGRVMLNPFEQRIEPDERERRRLMYESRIEYYFRERPWNTDEEIAEAVDQALLSKGKMPTIDQLSKIRAMLSQAKVAAVQQWINDREEESEPVILFSQHVSILKKIASRPGWECFHGGLTAKKRSKMVKRFQAGEIEHGLAVSIGAGGEGITLTRAGVCAFIDLSWNPAKNAQTESRLIRIGAEIHSKIVVVRFVAKHCVDELVMETLKEKETLLRALEWNESEYD